MRIWTVAKTFSVAVRDDTFFICSKISDRKFLQLCCFGIDILRRKIIKHSTENHDQEDNHDTIQKSKLFCFYLLLIPTFVAL